jgi:peptidoglycan hydrolase-like protein with peptidoglycan-binding domain
MRFREIVIEAETQELEAGPPYPPEVVPAVKDLQKKLQDLGYAVGSTGIDGKYGPRTTRAVRAFKQDYRVPGDGLSINAAGLKKLDDVASGKIPRVKQPTQIDTSGPGGELGPLAQDSVTQGKVGAVLDFIARPESAGRYDAVYPGRRRPEILEMTIAQLIEDMKVRGRATGSSASGRYQYIRKTLEGLIGSMGIDPNTTKFDRETQDRIAIYHLRKDHGLDRWLAGRMSNEQFLDKLSKTWAGLPNPGTGGSFYAGVLDNKAGMGVQSALASLNQIQRTA